MERSRLRKNMKSWTQLHALLSIKLCLHLAFVVSLSPLHLPLMFCKKYTVHLLEIDRGLVLVQSGTKGLYSRYKR